MLLMAVSAEACTLHTPDTGVGIAVAREAIGPGIAVPVAVHIGHEPADVRLRIRTFEPVGIHMAGDARRIGALSVMTGSAGFHIASRQLRMQTTTGSDADRHKSRLLMRRRLEGDLVDIPPCGMTCCAELLLTVAGLTIRRFPLGRDAVGETEVKIVHLQERRRFAAVHSHRPG